MNRIRWVIVALTLAVLLVGAYFIYAQYGSENVPQVEYTDEQGEPTASESVAPDFTVVDKNGDDVSLSDFSGKPVVLNFWASWCPPCQSEMPDFEDVYLEYGDDVVFMMVNLTDDYGESVEVASGFIEEQGYTFPVYYDVYTEGAYAYQVSSVPATYFVDTDGNIAAYAVGALNKDALLQGIDMIR